MAPRVKLPEPEAPPPAAAPRLSLAEMMKRKAAKAIPAEAAAQQIAEAPFDGGKVPGAEADPITASAGFVPRPVKPRPASGGFFPVEAPAPKLGPNDRPPGSPPAAMLGEPKPLPKKHTIHMVEVNHGHIARTMSETADKWPEQAFAAYLRHGAVALLEMTWLLNRLNEDFKALWIKAGNDADDLPNFVEKADIMLASMEKWNGPAQEPEA